MKKTTSILTLTVFCALASTLTAETKPLLHHPIHEHEFYNGETALNVADAWALEGDELVCDGDPKGYLILAENMSDYTLTLEWKWDAAEGGNSGVLIHALPATSGFRTWPSSIEIQLQSGMAGDIYAIGQLPGFTGEGSVFVAPGVPVVRLDRKADADKPLGEWNALEVIATEDQVTVKVNGQIVNEIGRVKPNQGAIALQSEGAAIRFRNIELNQKSIDVLD